MYAAILFRTTVATIVAYLGAGTGAAIGGAAKRHLVLLVNAALGALLAVTIFDIVPDARESISAAAIPHWLLATFAGCPAGILKTGELVLSIASGYLLFWVIGKYVYPVCPACSLDKLSGTKQMLSHTLVLLMIAMGVHSTMDGVAVVVGDEIKGGINLPVFLAVSVHKYPEGLALVLLLIGAGYSRMRALGWSLAIEATTELGALGAILLASRMSPLWLGLTFANVGGGFLYLVINAFLFIQHPHTGHAHSGADEREHDHDHDHEHEHGHNTGHEPAPGHSVLARFGAGGIAFVVTWGLIFASQVMVH